MKLLYITNGINGAGGLERVLSIKASYLAQHYNYEVSILSLNDNHINPFYEFSDKIKMLSITVDGNPFQYIKAYKKGITQTVNQMKPDVISVCDDGLKAYFIPKIISKRIPLIYERHVSKEIEMRDDYSFIKKTIIKSKWRLMERMAKSYRKYVVLTEGNKKEWKGLKNLEVIANPVSFYPNEKSSLLQKQVICVGKQSYQKGQDLVIRAWEKVNQIHPDWNLVLYGKLEPSLNLDKIRRNLNLEDSVFFYKPEKDIQAKYLDSSIYVMSSRFEGFGMVLVEAMACGVPCVSFDCNYGPSDIIQDGKDGYVVENGNIEKLSLKLLKLIEDKDLRIEMGAQAKQNVKRYLPEIIVSQWDELFKSLVS
ncbi:glycosyltransferase family 4 protein [Mesonia mobilis]|uniref:Glycosyl transferase n=1 Tax=Mesonia mobilis TaxID=369791 RepID=A0ABQ3BU53_9FLAO|nr:glycosyltransferase family 4 protein [Mesonia mobilis]MBQ0736948.1 glycosyltransferase family 4 protein [Aquimarina celericrescens]GGZ56829.1 glycosyl transferase [Mesonia mobilis]